MADERRPTFGEVRISETIGFRPLEPSGACDLMMLPIDMTPVLWPVDPGG